MGIISFLNTLILGKKDAECEDEKADINLNTAEINIESEILAGIDKSKRKIAFFKNGILYNVSPRNKSVTLYEDRQVAYDSDTIIISDEDMYDPEKPKSVNKLRIPCFPQIDNGVVFDLSYILKMRCSLIENPAVIPIFVNKTLAMMEASPIEWERRDYLRVICNYYCNGLFKEGDRFEKLYRDSHANIFSWPYDAIYEAEHLNNKYYFEDKWYRYQEYKELKSLFPDRVPNTVRGYLQIRTRQTKSFLEIKEAAEKQGFVFYAKKNCHYCRKLNTYVHFSQKYDNSNRYPMLISIQCELYEKGFCNGMDEFGLACVYPIS